ncbi:hypothetical protein ABE51_10580 [Bacillus thuringiensis]|nr:hypothetical protein [Bacillus thuringiensis]
MQLSKMSIIFDKAYKVYILIFIGSVAKFKKTKSIHNLDALQSILQKLAYFQNFATESKNKIYKRCLI